MRCLGEVVSEAGVRIGYTVNTTAENDPTSYHDEQEKDDLENAEKVHSVDTDLGEECVQQSDEDNNTNGNASLFPFGGYVTGREKDIGRKNDTSLG